MIDNPTLRFEIFTLFPGMFTGPFEKSILRRAADQELIRVSLHDIRTWATDRHRSVDDTPYGGGAGMVMMAPPVVDAVESVLGVASASTRILLLTAGGRRFSQAIAAELATAQRIALICGHYEGIDQRAAEILHAEEVSIGDYVLTGGELAAMVVVDAVARLIPGVIDPASIAEESHGSSLVEYPQYTRPAEYRGLAVPPILFSGHHAKIAAWRRQQAILRTARLRPDLLATASISDTDQTEIDLPSAANLSSDPTR